MIFDQEHLEQQLALDKAFESGYYKGRDEADAYIIADSAELRENHRVELDKAYRDGAEAALLYACLFVAVIVAFAFFGRIVFEGLAGWLTS